MSFCVAKVSTRVLLLPDKTHQLCMHEIVALCLFIFTFYFFLHAASLLCGEAAIVKSVRMYQLRMCLL